MRKALLFAFVLFLSGLAVAANQETLEELKARAESAKAADQVKLFIQLAERQVKTASDAYGQGEAAAGKAAVEEAVLYCERAGAAARNSGKHLKQAEIRVRDLERKLEAMQRSVSYDDREPLKAAVDRLEKTRSELLATMFRKK